MSNITTDYKGIRIEYDAQRNVWRFVLRGREKSAQSLTNAKEAIDKPATKDRTAFDEVSAWLARGARDIELVTVTSIAEKNWSWHGYEVWVIYKCGRRSKERLNCLFIDSDNNRSIINNIYGFKAEIEKLHAAMEASRNQLEKLTIDTTPE